VALSRAVRCHSRQMKVVFFGSIARRMSCASLNSTFLCGLYIHPSTILFVFVRLFQISNSLVHQNKMENVAYTNSHCRAGESSECLTSVNLPVINMPGPHNFSNPVTGQNNPTCSYCLRPGPVHSLCLANSNPGKKKMMKGEFFLSLS
jgi:hypothetical protein